jgi:hypothetical protein
MTTKSYLGSIDALKELMRLQTILRKIEDITNSDGEHDSDYSEVCDRVNELAREGLFPKGATTSPQPRSQDQLGE